LNSNNVTAAFGGARYNLFFFFLASVAINFIAIEFLIGEVNQGYGAISFLKSENPSIGAVKVGGEKIVFASLASLNSDYVALKNRATTAPPIVSITNASEPFSSSNQSPSSAASGGDGQTRISAAEVAEQGGGKPKDASSVAENSPFSFDGMPAMPLAVPGTTSRGLFSRPPEIFPIPQAISDPKQLAQSKRIRAQAKVNESLSKLRANWQRKAIGAECLVWVDPDWHQFSVDCEPAAPTQSELIFALSSDQFSPSKNTPDVSWHCINFSTEQQRKTCPDQRK
jgi:hypothetical protein